MVKTTVEYKGELRCEATHAPSGQTIITDAPVDNQGKGEAFSPTDLVAAALGSCMMTIMGIVAQRHDINLTGATITVEKEMSASAPRRISKLSVNVKVPQRLSEENRLRLEHGAMTCPVHKSLHPDVQVPIQFDWAD